MFILCDKGVCIYWYMNIYQLARSLLVGFNTKRLAHYLTRLPTQYWPLTFSPVWYSNVVATKAFPPILWNAWHYRLGFLQSDRYLGRMRTYHGPKAGRIFFLTNLNKRAPFVRYKLSYRKCTDCGEWVQTNYANLCK